MYKLEELNTKKVAELQVIAKELYIKKPEKLNKEELAYAILDCQAENTKATTNPIRKPRPRTKSTKNKAEEVKDSETQSIHKKKKESQTSNQTAHNQSTRKEKQKPIQKQKNNEDGKYDAKKE